MKTFLKNSQKNENLVNWIQEILINAERLGMTQ